MATWFALLCAVDDEVERMDAQAAELAIASSVVALRASVNPEERKDSIYSPACVDCGTRLTLALTKAFASQLRGLVPRTLYESLVKKIVDVWQAMAIERELRGQSAVEQAEYLRVRSCTVGLEPFFVLLEHALRSDTSDSNVRLVLEELQRHISCIVGLQNDIAGFRKDIAVGETFNILVLNGREPGASLSTSLEKVLKMHNSIVKAAVACRDKIELYCGSNCAATEYAESLLGFVPRHFVWASKAERYTV